MVFYICKNFHEKNLERFKRYGEDEANMKLPGLYEKYKGASSPILSQPDRIKKRRVFNALVVYAVTYLRCHVTLVFTAHDVIKTEKDVSLCKLDIDEKNRTVIVGNVGFFKL